MKIFFTILISLTISACKNDPKTEEVKNNTEINQKEIVDSLKISDKDFDQQNKTLNLKQRELIEKKDNKDELQDLVISKSFFKQDDWYTMDFKYPYLNEKIKPPYENFNEYIAKYDLDAKRGRKGTSGRKTSL